jgi:hypothetical protein
VQLSEALVAPTLFEADPLGQFIGKHEVYAPPGEYVPAEQVVHPEVLVVAPVAVA